MYTLTVGRSYTLQATVTNRSTGAGVPVAADLTVIVRIPVAGSLVLDDSMRQLIGPGASWMFGFGFIPTIAGGGQIQAWLYPTSDPTQILRTISEPVQVIAPRPAPTASIGQGLIWFEGLAGWQWARDVPNIPVGVAVYLAPLWMNESSNPIVGHVNLYITPPLGGLLTPPATANQDRSAAPGDGWFVQFASFLADQPGVYEIQADVLVDGVRQAWTTYELRAA